MNTTSNTNTDPTLVPLFPFHLTSLPGDGQRHMCLWTRDVTHVTGFAQKADPHQNSCVTLPLLLQIG